MQKLLFTTLLATAAALTSTGARHRAVSPPKPLTIDISRSLVITDLDTLEAFSLERVLQTLIADTGATTTPLALYRQMFDTQNPKPGLAVANAPHCDDFTTNGKPSFNGFPRRCPTPEGILATTDPFTSHDYAPIGITNRFDLAPPNGANCGQYRIIFAKVTAARGEKVHIIFEPVIPNPNPDKGVEGCRAVAQFWADLSSDESASDRRTRIEQFFFDGIPGFEPALRAGHFAANTGRIRTMQLGGARLVPRFYQFQLAVNGSRLLAVPGLLENYPRAPLFNASATTSAGSEFRQFFISQVATLAARDVNAFGDQIPDKYLIVESDPEDDTLSVLSESAYQQGLSTPAGQAFNSAIAAELKRIGSNLQPADIVARAQMQNCSGCHTGGESIGESLTFPSASNGTHIDDTPETVNGVTRFAISPALRDVFAPNRARILLDFLAGKPLPPHSN